MHLCRVALLAVAILLLASCSNFVFYPSKNWQTTPKQHGYDYQNFYYPADDGTALNAWFMPETTGDKKGLIIYFHGNSQNIGSHVGQVYWLTDQGFDVFLMDYRGFGKSKGEVDLEKSLDDIAATLRYAYKHYPEKNTYVLAQSLGASMAGFVLGNNKNLRAPLKGIVLDAGFTNYKAITKDVMSRHWLTWSLQYPASWTMPKNYGLDSVIGNISPTPLLIIHGSKDNVVPYRFGEQLFAKAKEPKAFLRYDGGHIAAFYNPHNRQLLLDWLAQPVAQMPKKNWQSRCVLAANCVKFALFKPPAF